jgi:uncharacterized protein (TIGR03435 family)
MTAPDLSPLANHLWQSTLCVAVAWLLTLALRNNRASARYWVWLAASVKFLIPFSLLVSAGGHLGWRTTHAVGQPRFFLAMEQISQPFAVQAPMPLPRMGATSVNPVPAILLGVWLCGVAIGTVFWACRWRRIQSLRRAATPLDLNLPIRVMSSGGRLEPGVVGIFRLVLLLPEGIMSHLTPAQLEAILAHELRHVQRQDNLTAAIHMLVETLFWFYPLTWWLRLRLIEERERACDEEVVQMGSEPQVYAESILKVCEFYLASLAPCAAGVTGGRLKQRIEGIMANRLTEKLSRGRKALLASAAILALSGPMVAGLINPTRSRAQSGGAVVPPPQFEVASVKRNPTCGARRGGPGPSSPGRINLECQTVLGLMMTAYGVFADGVTVSPTIPEITGGPGWVTSDPYDVAAKAEGDAPFPRMAGPMLRALLEDRFKLRVHRETKEVPVYYLTVVKTGPKLEPTKEGSCVPIDPNHPPAPVATPGERRPTYCGPRFQRRGSTMTVASHGGTMEQLTAAILSRIVDRPVFDKTGLAGRYDFQIEFEYVPDSGNAGDLGAPQSPAVLDGPSIFAVLQAKLGLKLEPGKGPNEILVIDRVERPTEN